MIIRNAKPKDIDEIVAGHKRCFPRESRAEHSLCRYVYLEYMREYPDFFFVAEEDGYVVGISAGFPHWLHSPAANVNKHFFWQVLFLKLCLLLRLDREMWKRVRNKLFHRIVDEENYQKRSNRFDGLRGWDVGFGGYTFVLPEYRYTRAGWKLVEARENALRNAGMKAEFINVRQYNKRVQQFDKFRGYEVIYEGNKNVLMGKML